MELKERQANEAKSEELLQLIENLDPAEKWKLLDKMYDKYYNKGELPATDEPEEDNPYDY